MNESRPGGGAYVLTASTNAFGEQIDVVVRLEAGGWSETVTVDGKLLRARGLPPDSAVGHAARMVLTLSEAATVNWPEGGRG